MKKEWFLGMALGLTVFLGVVGANVLPFLLLGALVYLLLASGRLGDIGRRKVGVIPGEVPEVTFDDIGGQSVAKRELREALDFLKDQERAKKLGVRPLRGILLVGPPGTGKTLLARAAAHYTDSVFISASGSEFIEVYAGVGAQRVRELFARARRLAKERKKSGAIVFIDEIEVLAGKRGAQVGHLEYDQTLNQLLVEMDGLTSGDGVTILVIGATNRPDLLDPAIERPGRFDRIVRVDLPDKEGRREILALHLRNKPLAPDVDLEELAKQTFGFSGAHLESLANEAAIAALRDGSTVITRAHLESAIDKVIMGEKLERRPSAEELYRVAIHEAGHAIVTERIRPGTVASVTVSPRGMALGYVRHFPKDDVFLYPKEVLEDEIAILLAGAVAEDIAFGSRSTGAANDFAQALNLAKNIVAGGMSPLGVVDRDTAPPEALAQATREILTRAERRVHRILVRHKRTLTEVARILVQKESVTGDELRRITGVKKGPAWVYRKTPTPRRRKRLSGEIRAAG
ncbi:MAG: AAA family ATPase [Firmicutes bacterium]|nr:AAA family ATPase [Candidatus Fermentithermobacillaceae bacterium]